LPVIAPVTSNPTQTLSGTAPSVSSAVPPINGALVHLSPDCVHGPLLSEKSLDTA